MSFSTHSSRANPSSAPLPTPGDLELLPEGRPGGLLGFARPGLLQAHCPPFLPNTGPSAPGGCLDTFLALQERSPSWAPLRGFFFEASIRFSRFCAQVKTQLVPPLHRMPRRPQGGVAFLRLERRTRLYFDRIGRYFRGLHGFAQYAPSWSIPNSLGGVFPNAHARGRGALAA